MTPAEVNFASMHRGFRQAVHLATGVKSLKTVERWCHEPHPEGDGLLSPLETHIRTVWGLRKAGAPNAELPLLYACDELGYMPPVRIAEITDGCSPVSSAALMRCCADAIDEHEAAISDGSVSTGEVDAMDAKLAEVERVAARQRAGLRPRIISADAPLITGPRKGPKSSPSLIDIRGALIA